MKIVVDVSPLSSPRTGIGNYLVGMLAGILEAGEGKHEVVAFGPSGPRSRQRIAEALTGLPLELRLPLLPRAHAWRTAWSRLGRVPVERLVGELDVFHFSDWMYPPQRHGVRATTVYDLVPLQHPEWTQRATRRMHLAKYAALASCDRIFAISRYTAERTIELLGIPEERVALAYPGIDPRFTVDGERAELGSPYILAVSTLEPRKNLPSLVSAFTELRRRLPELTLALAGLAGWEQRPLGADGVRLLGYVSDDELAKLYRGAAAFAYPSRLEGFGIPIVEALASGVPVVAAKHPSLDEACGAAALRTDPDDRVAFAAELEHALERPAGLRDRGLSHAARFTRRALGDAVLTGYESALRH